MECGNRDRPAGEKRAGGEKEFRKEVNQGEKILRKKAVYKAEMDRIMPREKSDALWRKAAGILDSILDQHPSLPGGVRMHTGKIFPAAAVYLAAKDVLPKPPSSPSEILSTCRLQAASTRQLPAT